MEPRGKRLAGILRRVCRIGVSCVGVAMMALMVAVLTIQIGAIAFCKALDYIDTWRG